MKSRKKKQRYFISAKRERNFYLNPNRSHTNRELLVNCMSNEKWWTGWALSKAMFPDTPNQIRLYEQSESEWHAPGTIPSHACMFRPGQYPHIMKAYERIKDTLKVGVQEGWIQKANMQRPRRGDRGKAIGGNVRVYKLVRRPKQRMAAEYEHEGLKTFAEARNRISRNRHLTGKAYQLMCG